MLPDFQQQRVLLNEYLKKYKNVAVVGHNQSLRRYAGYKLKNCEVFPLAREQLNQL
jgi:predicted CoA-binding protein